MHRKVSINTGNSDKEIPCNDGSTIFYYARYKNSTPDLTKRHLGLTIGYNFKRLIFEVGLLTEVSRFTGEVKYLTSPLGAPLRSNRYYLASQSESFGVSNLRFPLRVYYHIHPQKGKSSFNTICFFAGLDLLTPSVSAWGDAPVWSLSSETLITVYSQEVITYELGTRQNNNLVTLAPSVGFMIKLKYKNKFEICNLHLDWHFDGFKAMGSHKVVFTNSKGDSYTFYNRLSAQGIIFKLSRDFTFKNKVIHKKVLG